MELTKLGQAIDFSFGELVDELCDLRKRQRNIEEARWMLERRIANLMEGDGATTTRTGNHVVRMTRPVSYDATKLAALREITDPIDLEGVYAPESEEVRRVPEKWNMVKGRRLLALGNDHRDIIESAKVFGNPKIEIFEKDERSTR